MPSQSEQGKPTFADWKIPAQQALTERIQALEAARDALEQTPGLAIQVPVGQPISLKEIIGKGIGDINATATPPARRREIAASVNELVPAFRAFRQAGVDSLQVTVPAHEEPPTPIQRQWVPEDIEFVKVDERGNETHRFYGIPVTFGPVEALLLQWGFSGREVYRKPGPILFRDLAQELRIPAMVLKRCAYNMRDKLRTNPRARGIIIVDADSITFSNPDEYNEE